MPKGDIILVPFLFTDLTGSKLRPVVVLIDNQPDLTVSFITTQLQWQEPTDILINPAATNGIKKPSLIRLSKIATLHKGLILGKMGQLTDIQIADLNSKLKILLQIP